MGDIPCVWLLDGHLACPPRLLHLGCPETGLSVLLLHDELLEYFVVEQSIGSPRGPFTAQNKSTYINAFMRHIGAQSNGPTLFHSGPSKWPVHDLHTRPFVF